MTEIRHHNSICVDKLWRVPTSWRVCFATIYVCLTPCSFHSDRTWPTKHHRYWRGFQKYLACPSASSLTSLFRSTITYGRTPTSSYTQPKKSPAKKASMNSCKASGTELMQSRACTGLGSLRYLFSYTICFQLLSLIHIFCFSSLVQRPRKRRHGTTGRRQTWWRTTGDARQWLMDCFKTPYCKYLTDPPIFISNYTRVTLLYSLSHSFLNSYSLALQYCVQTF